MSRPEEKKLTAFVCSPFVAARSRWLTTTSPRAELCTRRRRTCSQPARMQLPPFPQEEPPLTEEEAGPEGYKWNPDFPGTLKPGSEPDNFPLDKVLASGVYERMEYQEIDMDDCTPEVFPLEEDMLEWLVKQGRMLPRGVSEDEFDTEAERQITGITEEDLEFADDDSKMIAYYSKQGDGGLSAFGPFGEGDYNNSGFF